MAKPDDLLSAPQAGEILNIGRRQVLNLIADGMLPAQKIGNSFAIRRADLAKVKPRRPGPKAREHHE